MGGNFDVFLLLLNNISIFVVLIVGYSYLIDLLRPWKNASRQLVLGLFFGLVAIGSMYVKIPVAEGVIVDQRNAIIVLCGAFGGPWAAVIGGVMAGAYRTYLGGAGALAGVFGLTLSAIVGGGLYYMRWYKTDAIRLAIGAFLAVLLTAPGFLLVGDFWFGLDLMKRMIVPWGAAIFTGIFVGGLLLAREDRRQRLEREKQDSQSLFERLFESSTGAYWIADFRAVLDTLNTIRKSGVRDLRVYLGQNPEVQEKLARQVSISHMNQACLLLYGADSKDALIRARGRVFGPDGRRVFVEQLCAIWDRAERVAVETEHNRLDGAVLSVIVSMPIPNDPSEFAAIPVNVVDLTERVAAERARDEALREAREADRAKSRFLAAMSHELRTPLNAILGFSEAIQQRMFGPPGKGVYREYAGYIHSSGKMLLSLVEDILDVAEIEEGKKSLTLEKFDLAGAVGDCVAMLKHRADESGLTITTAIPDGLPQAFGDRRAVQQVLLNLLSNSVKYTPSGGSIRIEALAVDGATEIRVIDTGKGIPADRLHDVLEPFIRGETDPHRAHEGWGLGLSIARSLVTLHEGEFRITSAVGEGTTVAFTLPDPRN